MDRTEYFYHSQRNHFPEESQASDSVYTEKIDEVIASEREYLQARRHTYGETRPGDQPDQLQDIWGLAISGGGIRSATLGLGMLQRLVEKHLLQKFDYLSTVSGGGYIGSCFSTLMNTQPEQFVQPATTQLAAHNGQEHHIPGLTPATSPFMLLMEEKAAERKASTSLPLAGRTAELVPEAEAGPELVTDDSASRSFVPGIFEVEKGSSSDQGMTGPDIQQMDLAYKTVKETRLDARHQMHHLRTHGEYLTPEKRFFSPDMQRAIGTFLAGIVHNLLLFILALTVLVSAHYVLFEQVSGGEFFTLMYESFDPTQPLPAFEDLSPEQQAGLNDHWLDRIGVYLSLILDKTSEKNHVWFALGFLFSGLLFGLWSIRKSQQLSEKILEEEAAIRRREKESKSRSGQDVQAFFERDFLLKFNKLSIAGPLILLAIVYAAAHWLGLLQPDSYWVIFSWPFFAGLGIFLGVYVPTAVIGYPDEQPRVARALLGGLRGAAFYALLLSLLVPIGLLLLFSADRLLDGLVSGVSSVASIGVGYLVAATQSQSGDQDSMVGKLLNQLKAPLLSVSVVLFVLLSAVAILNGLRSGDNAFGAEVMFPLWLMVASLCLFLLLGYFVDANKLSLHYFYRDRLSEAYLRTDGRSRREAGMDRQGMPLINLRDDENLRLKDLGWELLAKEEAKAIKANPEAHPDCRQDADGQVWRVNARGPYHLIVTALNLQGSEELVRKDLRSDHFIFSRNYVGSQSTGYVKTGVYRDGKTKLARAAHAARARKSTTTAAPTRPAV
ncbi:MAG: patatin-like phospholipase family protein, partial [Bacteroidota bacterium]